MKTKRIIGGSLLTAALAAGWMLSAPVQAAGSETTITVKGESGNAPKGPQQPGPGVMDVNGRVLPPPRPSVITHVHPGMPHEDLKEADHERGPKFNVGQFRKANGKVYRD